MKLHAIAAAVLVTAASSAIAQGTQQADGQLRVIIREPTRPIARDRIDTIYCPGNRKIEVSIGHRRGAIAPGQSNYVVKMKADGRRVDASVIEPYLVGYSVLSSDVTLAACPDEASKVFSGEIAYWNRHGEDATWNDRVFIRFYVHPTGVTAERVQNIPTPDHLKPKPQN